MIEGWTKGLDEGMVRALVDTAPIFMYVYGKDMRFSYVNNTFAAFLGYEPEKLQGVFILDICTALQPDGSNSFDRLKEFAQDLSGEGFIHTDWTFRKSTGAPAATELWLKRLAYGGEAFTVGYARDVGNRKANAENLSDAGNTAHALMMSNPTAMVLWKGAERPIVCNNETVTLFDAAGAQDVLNSIDDFSPEVQPGGDQSARLLRACLNEALEDGRSRREWMHRTSGGVLIPTNLQLVRLDSADGDIIAMYIQDLREFNNTVKLLNNLEKLAFVDGLTGAYNRRYFMEHAERAFEQCKRENKGLSIVMFDLDLFKTVNDTYGHIVGDEILKMVVKATQGTLRSYDILARYGGEEFIVLISRADGELARRMAERMRASVEKAVYYHDDEPISITISLGVSVLTARDESLSDLIKRADAALYRAKSGGRNMAMNDADGFIPNPGETGVYD